jgi:cell division cycle 20, cofactor of APC complex
MMDNGGPVVGLGQKSSISLNPSFPILVTPTKFRSTPSGSRAACAATPQTPARSLFREQSEYVSLLPAPRWAAPVCRSGGGLYASSAPSTPQRILSNSVSTPLSKHRSRQEQHDDRYIPSRRNVNLDLCRRALVPTSEKRPNRRRKCRVDSAGNQIVEDGYDSNNDDDEVDGNLDDRSRRDNRNARKAKATETALQKEYKRRMLSSLCNVPLNKLTEEAELTGLLAIGANGGTQDTKHDKTSKVNGTSPIPGNVTNPFAHDLLRTMKLGGQHYDVHDDVASNHSVTTKMVRKIPGAPVRVLDAPDIVDDYYLNLINWSRDNILAVALAKSVYLWNAATGEINRLVSLEDETTDYVTSVSWCTQSGHTHYIAVGTNSHAVHVYDGNVQRRVSSLCGHTGRVSALGWCNHHLSSGGRDSIILNHDIRVSQHVTTKYVGHEQEVCGLKWNDDSTTLASGGNENYLCLWDAAMSGSSSNRRRSHGLRNDEYAPRLVLDEHRAAVKALDWCPFHRGLLASGGGTIDRTIKFWNSNSGTCLNSIDTGSQVCSVLWSRTRHREIVSSHGYSENQLIVWKYPTMMKVKELKGHTARVLHMDMSPDATTIVSAAADETLRFWNIFGNETSLGAGTTSNKNKATVGAGGRRNLLGTNLTFGGPTIR